MLTTAIKCVTQNNVFMKTHPNKCNHEQTEKRFVDYLFTEELFAMFCKTCNKQITETKTSHL